MLISIIIKKVLYAKYLSLAVANKYLMVTDKGLFNDI